MLRIRRYRNDDYQDLFEILSKEEAVQYELYGTLSLDECKEEAFFRSLSPDFFAVVLDKKMIGSLFYGENNGKHELGFIFNPSYWHKGYAFQSSKMLLKRIKDKVIYAKCFRENTDSRKLLEKLGFVVETDDDIMEYVLRRDENESVFKVL